MCIIDHMPVYVFARSQLCVIKTLVSILQRSFRCFLQSKLKGNEFMGVSVANFRAKSLARNKSDIYFYVYSYELNECILLWIHARHSIL